MSATLATKEFRDLQRRFKQGYTVEQARRGGHFKVLDPAGEPVRLNGRPLILASSPSDPSAHKVAERELEKAGVLRAPRKKPTKEVGERDRTAASALAQRNRAKAAKALKQRMAAVLEPVGGLSVEGMHADLAYIAAEIAREHGNVDMTPDLFMPSIRRLTDGNWVTPRYSEIWVTLAERLEAAKAQGQLQGRFFQMLRQARGLPEQTMIDHQQLGLQTGEWPFRVELLPLERCLVDHSYQRPAVWLFIRKIARSFDATLVGTIDVSERHRGATYAILDGQLRFEAMKLVGKTQVWASIYEGLDHQAEARFFLHKNRDRKAVHPYYTFRANLIAQDPRWTQIDAIVRKYDYEIAIGAANNVRENNISAIQAVGEAFDRKSVNGNCLDLTLKLLRQTTLGRRHGQDAHLIRGLARMFEAYPKIDWERLRLVVADKGPDWIVGNARVESRRASGSVALWVVRVISNEYNRGFTPKLPKV